MYKEFQVKNFRGLSDVHLKNLSRINLITGKNGAGKSSALESIFVHCGAYNPDLLFTVAGQRGQTQYKFDDRVSPWDQFFRDYDPSRPIEFTATLNIKRDQYRRMLIRRSHLPPS